MSKKQYERGTRRGIISYLVAGCLVLGAIFGGMQYLEKKNEVKIEREQDDLNRNVMKANNITYDGVDYVRNKNVKSYLLIGTDISDQAEVNQAAVENGLVAVMADALYLVVVDDEQESYTILQLDRNTITDVDMLDVDGELVTTVLAQLCTSYYYGTDRATGAENTLKSVSTLLNGIKIDGYASFTMDSIPVINNMVGGVTVTLEEDYSDIDKAMKKGKTITLNDEQAYTYVQRRMDVGNGTNSARLLRQTGYIDALLNQAKQLAKEDSTFINGVYQRLDEVMTTDFDGAAFGKLLNSAMSYENKGIVTIEGETKRGKILGDGIEHEEFYPDSNSISEVILKLYYKEK